MVQDALLRKKEDENVKDKLQLLEMNDAAKLALHNKLESVSGKQFITEKGFESLREQWTQNKKEKDNMEFNLNSHKKELENKKNDIRLQFNKFNEVTNEKEHERSNYQKEMVKTSKLSNNICVISEQLSQEKMKVKVLEEKLLSLEEERQQKLSATERLKVAENGRLQINDKLMDTSKEFDNHRKEWNLVSNDKDNKLKEANDEINSRRREIQKWSTENSSLQKHVEVVGIKVEELRMQLSTKIDVELMRDAQTRLANEHYKAKWEVIAELYKLADGYELMSRH